MDAHIKDLWVAALRSGQYKQTREVLCNPTEGHCCLGVLTELFDAANPGVLGRLAGSSETVFDWTTDDGSIDSTNTELPAPVLDWAGMQTTEGALACIEEREELRPGQGAICLARFNDNGLTFLQIADIIDCFWEEL